MVLRSARIARSLGPGPRTCVSGRSRTAYAARCSLSSSALRAHHVWGGILHIGFETATGCVEAPLVGGADVDRDVGQSGLAGGFDAVAPLGDDEPLAVDHLGLEPVVGTGRGEQVVIGVAHGASPRIGTGAHPKEVLCTRPRAELVVDGRDVSHVGPHLFGSCLLRRRHRFVLLKLSCWDSFDGTQSYFALDGQHRLRAIKDALKKDPSLGSEDIAVLIVSHYENEAGRERTRRLFTNINRNAKVTTAAENIALDEDDGYSVLTRRFLTDHEFLAKDKVVKVTFVGDEGERRLAGKQIPATDKFAFTTIVLLRALLQDLWFESATQDLKDRPPAEVLDEAYDVLTQRVDSLLKACGDIVGRLESATSAREVRSPKGQEGSGHPLMRPIVQQAVVRVVRQIVNQKALTFEEVLSRLAELDWALQAAPWTAVYNVSTNKMITAEENVDLLAKLLYVHLAPPSMQEVKRARKAFKDITHAAYPIAEDVLAARVDSSRPAVGGDGVVVTDDISEEPMAIESAEEPAG